ncbi:hypothetical protein SAMN05216371_4424 [Streptomyces sp. TLI_053]|uniref:hypothetical protein n=1 Tax=Streptomyces sp. TLI_053 TaxID=1855352 RepID=UPI00087DBF23|nr:hypothetical protein [Streptomyces sp. TLI_053]SDT73150.1 hypothetical protein SAMN05216371_4424 [Streptomyces sp. TLI_053]
MTIQFFPGSAEPVAFRAALRLYPARYRRERGDELSAVFADSTAEGGRLATAREAFDLGAYGLRMRTGLTSSSTAGRLLALAAPLIAGAIAGLGLTRVLHDATGRAPGWMWELPDRAVQVPFHAWYFGSVLAPLLLVGAVLAGRWRLARAAAVAVAAVGALGVALAVLAMPNFWLMFNQSCEATPQLFAGLLFALAPQELLRRRQTWSDRAMVLAATVGGGLVLVAEDFYSSWVLMDWKAGAALVLVPLLALLLAARDRLVPAAAGLAVLPLTLTFSLFRIWQSIGGVWRLLPVVGLVVVATVVAGGLLRRGAGAGGHRSLA